MMISKDDLTTLLKLAEAFRLAAQNPHVVGFDSEDLLAISRLAGRVDQTINRIMETHGPITS